MDGTVVVCRNPPGLFLTPGDDKVTKETLWLVVHSSCALGNTMVCIHIAKDKVSALSPIEGKC